MGITVTVAATTSLFADRERIKTELGIAYSSEDDFMDACILAVGGWIEIITGRVWKKETVLETIRGSGTTILTLDRAPILAVSSVTSDQDDPITDTEVEDADAGLLYRPGGWSMAYVPAWFLTAQLARTSQILNVKVTYQAGYDMAEAGTPTLPEV